MSCLTRRHVAVALAVCCAMAVGSAAQACKVPVFRYALDHWRPDHYQLLILHRGTLPEASASLVGDLEAMVADPSRNVNLKVIRVDVAEENATTAEVAEILGPKYKAFDEPQMVLLYPQESNSGPFAWQGPLNSKNIASLIDSPARRQIAEWILDGESAVYVLISSGDADKDKVAEEKLRTELPRLEKSLKMREVDVIKSQKEFKGHAVTLRLGLKLIILDRRDPDEAIFATMLLRSEPDLETLGEPIAIPVFGRGRTYKALAGKGISTDWLEADCRFMIEDCSCEVKRENPGVDLIFAVNWDELIDGVAEIEQKEIPLSGLDIVTEPTPPENIIDDQSNTQPTDIQTTGTQSTDAQPTVSQPGDRQVADARNAGSSRASASPTPAYNPTTTSDDVLEATGSFGQRVMLWGLGAILLCAVFLALGTWRIRSGADNL